MTSRPDPASNLYLKSSAPASWSLAAPLSSSITANMQLITSLLVIGGLATSVAARNPAKSVGKKFDLPKPKLPTRNVQHVKRQYTVNETQPIITAPGAKSKCSPQRQ